MTPGDIISPRYRRIVENTFRADSNLDPDGFLTGLTPDCRFLLGGLAPVEGHAAIRTMLVRTFAAFSAVRHRLRRAFEGAEVLSYEATVTYTLRDGRMVPADYVNVLDFAGDLVRTYRIYIDLSVLSF